jgi:hypothetical protein
LLVTASALSALAQTLPHHNFAGTWEIPALVTIARAKAAQHPPGIPSPGPFEIAFPGQGHFRWSLLCHVSHEKVKPSVLAVRISKGKGAGKDSRHTCVICCCALSGHVLSNTRTCARASARTHARTHTHTHTHTHTVGGRVCMCVRQERERGRERGERERERERERLCLEPCDRQRRCTYPQPHACVKHSCHGCIQCVHAQTALLHHCSALTQISPRSFVIVSVILDHP